ncbi:hypothetical protein AHF37_00038 [Paragonimus kellicotti]|nr:hypothetical protein AHF37_00038 [Paragonimus kellicotti]
MRNGVSTGGFTYVFRGSSHESVPVGKIAFGLVQRKWGNISVDEPLEVKPYLFNLARDCLGAAHFAVDFNNKKTSAGDPLDSDHMAREFSMQFADTPVTVGQPILFRFNKKLLLVEVKKLSTMSMDGGDQPNSKIGILTGNTVITWERQPDAKLLLVGKAASMAESGAGAYQSIISPNWDFNQMGIGGLDKEFAAIFRRTFASRMFPPAIGKQLGLKHVRGMLLHGPPGTGKTLMARQIAFWTNAEEEEKRMGPHSALHIIVFDEIDAICKTRGSTAGGAGVHDTVVNQLLTKMDGVEQLNNVLVIGMTNRIDMIDEALLRPGRFEAFGAAEEELSAYAPRGIMTWGESVLAALKMGRLAVRAVGEAEVETYRPLTLLLEGPPKAGKTALAVEIARLSGFPFVKIVTSHKMIGFTEMAKCAAMKKIFDDGAKSSLSVVIVDNIEGLIEYNPVGPRFSNFIVQAIRDLVSQPLKAGRRMLVLATTSCRAELAEQNLTQAFSWHVHISVMTEPKHIMAALEEDDRFTPAERQRIERSIANSRFCIGIKHLIELIDLVSKTDLEYRVSAFLAKLEEEGTLSQH